MPPTADALRDLAPAAAIDALGGPATAEYTLHSPPSILREFIQDQQPVAVELEDGQLLLGVFHPVQADDFGVGIDLDAGGIRWIRRVQDIKHVWTLSVPGQAS